MSKVSKNTKPANALTAEPDIDGNVMQRLFWIIAVVCIISTILFDKTKTMGGATFPVMGLLAVAFCAVVLAYEKKLTTQNAVILLIAAGFVLRLNYVIYTPLSETSRIRQHDLYDWGGERGHSAYIEHFYNNGFTLPDFDPTSKAQFYHPPLHHLLAAMWMRILTTFGMGYSRAIGSIQFLTLFYSSCCMIVCERIFTKLRLNGAGKIIAMSIVAFHPTFILLAGSVNNDILSILFTLLSVYTALRWYDDPTTKNILYIALSIGLGMSTKLSAAVVAIPIALLFLLKLIEEKKKIYDNILQYCIFGVVCIPLGLWFSIRNAVRFKIPFTYVAKMSETSDQYVGDRTISERLFELAEPLKNVFINRISTGGDYYEYNLVAAIFKSSLFGEYNFANTNESITGACRFLLVFNIILILLSVAALVYYIIKGGEQTSKNPRIFIIFYQIFLFIYYIKFCFDFPHDCSMDYRYIVPTCVMGAFFIGSFVQLLSNKLSAKNKNAALGLKYCVGSLAALFCLGSSIVYIMLGVKK